jgi:MFS family permease
VEEESESTLAETPNLASGRRKLLVCILVSLFSLESVMMNVTTIIPNYVASRHKSLRDLEVAYIMTSFEVAALLFSPLVGLMLERLGRKTSIIIGFIVVIAASVGIACTAFIEHDQLYLWSAVIARFIQGIGDMWVQTTCKPN